MKILFLMLTLLTLTSCTSPPQSTLIELDKKSREFNHSALLNISHIQQLKASSNSSQKWQYSTFFPTTAEQASPVYYYALANAHKIIIYTDNANFWLTVKNKLQAQGAMAVIEWQFKKMFLAKQAQITFIRN
ncbi:MULTISPECIES: hypothetical protein [unclassified Arsenophonus]|uniref:hypothetical protein n=1 Tax=unclassified Arsenophonus TaxID=2627083 RepID=UPI0028634A3B|nr:hypothetical protein [Arsenophonus sp.]MDR5609752.1 hypothetical protein [Arsenophonus sp.]MDR5613468.1 hypothetical protein [Arsenophonus sp.]